MTKPGKRGGGNRGKKPDRARDLAVKRGGTAKGGADYTLFLPDGTPVRATPPRSPQVKEPSNIEYPN